MKRIKKILLLFLIILLSGCSVEYDLTINDDSSINEKVVAKEVTNRMEANTGINEEQSVSYLYDMFNRNNLNTKISTTNEENLTISTVTGSHKSIDKYVENFTSDIFEAANLSKKGNIVTLSFNQSKKISSTSAKSLIYDDITVNITLPFKVIDHNADYYDRETYTWEIKKDEDLRKIEIKYDQSDLKNSKSIGIGKYKFNVRYSFIAIGVILFIILVIILFVYHNNKKNNKI